MALMTTGVAAPLPSIDQRAILQRLLDDPQAEPIRRVDYADGELVVRVGHPVSETLLATSGELHVQRPGAAPVVLRAPFLIDRWMLDSFGHSRVDGVAANGVCGLFIGAADRARLLGSFPMLRRLSVIQRKLVFGEREHLPQSSRSSM